MSKITYIANLFMFVHYPEKEKKEDKIDHIKFPVHSFEVDGGANRKIVLASGNEQIIDSEFEQAQIHKNIIFYLKQNYEVPSAKLINLSKSDRKDFTVLFMVKAMKGETSLRTLSLRTKASFSEAAAPVGGTPALLKMKLSFCSSDLSEKVGEKSFEVIQQTEFGSCR